MSTPPVKEATYTPGPWKIVPLADRNLEITACPRSNAETDICVLYGGKRTTAANARLIGAAPDLLEALKGLLAAEMLNETALSFGDASAMDAANEAKWPAVDAAKAAIARAEGKTDHPS